jgi:hypothetical protein
MKKQPKQPEKHMMPGMPPKKMAPKAMPKTKKGGKC